MSGVTSIGQASGENVISVGQQVWNIADGFTKIKILRIIIEIDLYETIAKFGKKDLEEDVNPDLLSERRVEALERVLFDLKQLLGNCRFKLDEKKDKEIVAILYDRIENVEQNFDNVADEKRNDVTHERILAINEEHFNACFDILRNIKDELNFPIDRAGLIFRHDESINLDEVMRTIVEGG